jgi:branched-chain amino acid transport system ATP-binding protein
MTAAIKTEGLTKDYGGGRGLFDLDLEVAEGEVFGYLGPNGSGKSTTIDCISGFQAPDAGRWLLDGVELTGQKPHRHALAGMTRSFQAVRAYDELSLADNLAVAAQAHDGQGWWAALRAAPGLRRAEAAAAARAAELLQLVGLAAYAAAPAAILSYGQRKLLAIAAAMMIRPRLVVLDEPVAGLNPTMIRHIETVIRRLNADGTALLIVEHNLDFIMNLCERVIVLEQGRKIADGPPAVIRADRRVLAAYLGGSPAAAAHG